MTDHDDYLADRAEHHDCLAEEKARRLDDSFPCSDDDLGDRFVESILDRIRP